MKLIFDGKGQLRGRLDETNNHLQNVYGDHGQMLGVYDRISNRTFDKTGKPVGNGDQRTILLGEQKTS